MSLIPRETVESHHQTIWQENAATFATNHASYVDQERHAAIRDALGLIVDGRPGLALFKLVRSVQRQARVSGLGMVEITACPCGGRCERHDR